MQNPTIKTPIPRCEQVGTYAARMLNKFPKVPQHVEQAAKMTEITTALVKSSQAYEESKKAIVEARVDVRFIDYFSDKEIQNLIRRIEIADNKAGGPIFQVVAPEGKTALTKPFGQKQLDVLVDLKGKLTALVPTWSGAAAELALVEELRQSYQTALDTRAAAWQKARNLRVTRNVAKQAFLAGYLEVSFKVKAMYPQDRKMQDLFFDEIENEVEKDLGEEESAAPPPEGAEPPAGGGAPGNPPPA